MAEGSSAGITKVTKTKGIAEHYESELEIHDYPSNRRWEVIQQHTLRSVIEKTGASSIETMGNYIAPGQNPLPWQKKLYMLIKGPTEETVQNAKAELVRVLKDEPETAKA